MVKQCSSESQISSGIDGTQNVVLEFLDVFLREVKDFCLLKTPKQFHGL